MIKLRDYQERGEFLIKREFDKGNRKVMLWAQTGSGKGLWMAKFVKNCTEKGIPVLSVMRRRAIIFQTEKNYNNYYDIKSNLIMGSLKNKNNNLSTVASIDTLRNRIKNVKYEYLRNSQLVIIDECHDLTSITYKKLIWFIEGYSPEQFSEESFESLKNSFKKFYIGLTATPFRVGKRTHTFWDVIVKPIEAHELRDKGFLVNCKVMAPNKIDTTGVRINNKTGDFNEKEIFERVSKLQVVGDTIQTYKDCCLKEFGELKPAIGFCVNQKHSKIMTEAFNAAGIPSVYCDSDHSQEERDDAIKGLKNGRYLVLFNCNIFSTGFDAPFVEVLISARPSESENLTLQQWGRVLRPFKVCSSCGNEYGGDENCYKCGSNLISYEKKYALILDHANNTSRWGLPYDIRQPELEPIDTVKKNRTENSGVKTCPRCFAVVKNYDRFCVCNFDFVQDRLNSQDDVVNVKGELHEVDAEFIKEQIYQKIKQKYNTYRSLEMRYNWRPMAKHYKLHEEFGEKYLENASKFGVTREIKKILKDNLLARDLANFNESAFKENSKVIR